MGQRSRFVRDVIEWDVVNWSRALPFWKKHMPEHRDGIAMELGSRRGGLSLWLAAKGLRVICSDIRSPEADSLEKHRAYGVAGLISYQEVDAANIAYSDHFDVIAFKSLLGAIGRNDRTLLAQAIAQMHKALRAGGTLLFAENLSGSRLHKILRRRFVRWGTSWNYLELGEISELFSEFSALHFKVVGFFGALGRREWQRRALGCVDRALDWALPRGWRYVVIGVALR